MKTSKMNLGNLTSTILILTSFFCVQSAPAKPLNERSTELTWQAWLLVDDQNQNKQYDPEGLIRRRITPKSVFIAPTFSPESLPACADGYTSDPMGRCIKIIQLDADAHLNFILDRLKQQFGTFDEYEDDVDENLPTPGPFQFNIPLDEVEPGDSEEDTNVAIVVAPTNGSFNLSRNDTIKINNVKRDEKNNTSQIVDAPLIITRINIEPEVTTILEETETTTEPIETTTEFVPLTETELPTTTDLIEETTTLEIPTTMEPQAIFFKIPESSNQTGNNETHEMAASENSQNFVRFPVDDLKFTQQQLPEQERKQKFRDDTEEIISQLLPHAKVKTKFDTTEKLFEDYIRDAEMNDRLFKNRDTIHESTERVQQNPPQVYNHRNRDKWLFPPTWRDSPPQKPLVLRFNNLGPARHNNHFYQHHPRQQEGVYREVPPEDLSYIFGFKRGSGGGHR